MPLVQILKYREMGDKGQAILAEMAAVLKNMPEPQGGVGRLHLEGKTIGENPFDPVLCKAFSKWGYVLDSLNWIYWKKYDNDDAALKEMARLDAYRESLKRSWWDKTKALAEALQFRVMQDPVFEEGWDEVNMF